MTLCSLAACVLPPSPPPQCRPLLASQIARGDAITVSARPGTINLSQEQAANSIHFWCVFNYRHNCCDGMRSPSTRALKVEGTVRINQVSCQQSRSLCHIRSVSPLHDGEQFFSNRVCFPPRTHWLFLNVNPFLSSWSMTQAVTQAVLCECLLANVGKSIFVCIVTLPHCLDCFLWMAL